jgi:hypothetical protein
MTRCDRCARPIATDADWAHNPGCECERCLAVCWATGVCDTNGWRKRAEALEAAIRPLANHACYGTFAGQYGDCGRCLSCVARAALKNAEPHVGSEKEG